MNRKAISEPCHSLDRERGFVGVLAGRRAGQVSEIDWNSLLLGKKVLSDQELADAGVEAPRNSLESSPGTRTPRFSGVRHDDIPYAFEIPKPATPPHYSRSGEYFYNRSGELGKKKSATAEVLPIKTLIAQDSSDAEYERKRRSAPSVVARLMGLDALPDKLSKGSPAKPPKPSRSSSSNVFRRENSKPHSARAETSSKPPSPLHDHVDTIKDFPLPRSRGQTDADVFEDRAKFDVLPFRAHPQERQLQEFKKEFMEKLAHKRYGPPLPSSAAAAAGDKEGEKRRLLREKLSEAKLALASSGGDESRRLSSAHEKLLESKEFHDAIELLQTNKEFFKKFFPEPNSLAFGGNKDPPEPESTSRRSFHLEDLCRELPPRYEDTSRRSFHFGDFSKDSRKSSFLDDPSKESSRRSFHLDDLSKDSRKALLRHHHRHPHPHESPGKDSSGRRSFHLEDHSSRDSRRSQHYVDDVTKEIRALEDYSDSRHGGDNLTDSRGHSSSEHRKRREPRHKSPGANPVAEELVLLQKSSSKAESMDREAWAATTTQDINSGRQGSPNHFDPRKGSESPSRIVVLKPGPGEITLLTPAMDPSCSPQSYRIVRDSRGGLFEAREVILLDPKERFSPPRVEEPRYSRDEYRDPRVDPRAIARDIVREARTNSTRELSRDRETGRESPRHVSLTRISGGSTGGKRVSLPKYGQGVMDSTEEIIPENDETMGSFTLATLSRRHAMEEKSRSSTPTMPSPSPRIRSQETATTSDRFSHKEGKFRRLSDKPKAVYHVEQIEEHQNRKGLTEVRRTIVGQAHELNRAPMISRPRTYLPGIKAPSSNKVGRVDPILETQIRADDWNGAEVNMYPTLPSTEKILKVESMYPGNHIQNGGDEIQDIDISPRSLFNRTRSIPNAGAMVGTKIRNADVRSNGVGGHVVVPEKMETSEHFFLKEKRAEARQAFLFSKKKVTTTSDASSGRPGSHQAWPSESTAVQDVHVDTSVGPALAVQPHNICLLTRSSFENAVPIEDGPRNGSRACDQDILDALMQRTPQTTPSGISETAETDQLRKLSSHKQLEVPVNKQGAKSSKEWSIATETLENGDGDGASETSVDKCGQPSPVSVLDSPFEAEITSPVELKELNSDIQDLRLRLRLLKLDGTERSMALLESLQAKDKLVAQTLVVRHTENSLESTESTGSSITSTSFSIYRDLETQCLQSQALHFQPENIDIDGLPCPEGRQEELLYVRNILVASGFTESGTVLIGKWHSPTCPLDPGLYERLEDYYVDADLQVALEHGNVKSNSLTHGNQDSFHRRLLFDVVNEVLLQLLGPYLRYQPWVQPSKPCLRPVPTNRQLVSATWLEICTYFSPRGVEEFEALDCLMGKDVCRGAPWFDSPAFCEQIGVELEKTIFESLIEEIVHFLVPPTKYEQESGRLDCSIK